MARGHPYLHGRMLARGKPTPSWKETDRNMRIQRPIDGLMKLPKAAYQASRTRLGIVLTPVVAGSCLGLGIWAGMAGASKASVLACQYHFVLAYVGPHGPAIHPTINLYKTICCPPTAGEGTTICPPPPQLHHT